MRTLLVTSSLMLFMAMPSVWAATVTTKNGTFEGKVTSRMFEYTVVTLITNEKRVFQYAAADVDLIAATDSVLVSVNTFLRKEPSNSADPSIALSRGQEVNILKKNENSSWVLVQVWGKHEGWMIKELLTNKVVFTPEEKAQPGPAQRLSAEPMEIPSRNVEQDLGH